MQPDLGEEIAFGPFRLHPARRLLTRDGAPVQLGDRAFEILCLLVEQAPKMVGKKTMFERVWPGMYVEEVNLRFQIGALRKALGEENQYISTVKGRGYCFVAPLARPRTDRLPIATSKTNLPQPLTRIVAREAELIELQTCLSEHRLVTIVGAGGVGKTRLAVELGWRLLEEFAAGIWLVDLAPAGDLNALTSATATALGISLPTSENATEIIAAALGAQPRLLILDNCEHLIDVAAPLVRTLLETVPELRVLATSQQKLRLAEKIYQLYPLAVPPADAEDISNFGAVALLVQRVQSIDRRFALGPGNGAGLGEICRRLDGVPLALEMAAGRLHLLGVEGMQAALDERLKMLRGVSHGGARHVSLRAMLEWSHGLLDPGDQTLFRRLGIFPASFTFDAAVAVAGTTGTDRWELLDGLSRLVDRSLVAIEGREPVRYRLLETLRLFAAERLTDAGEHDDTAECHARHIRALFDVAAREWETMPDREWIARYRPEIENLRTALEWALGHPERHDFALALAASGANLFRDLYQAANGWQYLERVISHIGQDTPPAGAAHVFYQTSRLLIMRQEPEGLTYAERAAALYRQSGDHYGLASALGIVGFYHAVLHRPGGGLAVLQEAWELLADSNLRKRQLLVMNNWGAAAIVAGDYDAARRHLTQAHSLAKALKSLTENYIMINLSVMEQHAGNFARAADIAREAMPALRASPKRRDLETNASNLVAFLLAMNNPEEARQFAEEAMPPAGVADLPGLETLHNWGMLSVFEGRLREAAQLLGFVEAERVRREQPDHYNADRRLQDEVERRFAAALAQADLQALRAAGAHWTLAEATKFTLIQLLPPP